MASRLRHLAPGRFLRCGGSSPSVRGHVGSGCTGVVRAFGRDRPGHSYRPSGIRPIRWSGQRRSRNPSTKWPSRADVPWFCYDRTRVLANRSLVRCPSLVTVPRWRALRTTRLMSAGVPWFALVCLGNQGPLATTTIRCMKGHWLGFRGHSVHDDGRKQAPIPLRLA